MDRRAQHNLITAITCESIRPSDISYGGLENVLQTLSPREEMVLRMRFGLDDGQEQTLQGIGERLSVTRERVRQIMKKALRKLRHPQRSRCYILADGWEAEQRERAEKRKWFYSDPLDTTLEYLEFSVRAYNILKANKIDTVGAIVERTDYELLECKGMGNKTLAEIQFVVGKFLVTDMLERRKYKREQGMLPFEEWN